jgi:hypothetical protein
MSQSFSNQPVMPAAPSGPAASGAFPPAPYAPPPQKSRWWIWLLGGCGCSVVLLLLCCGGFTWWGITYSSNLVAGQLQHQLEGNEDVERTLGEIQSLNANLVESGEEKRKRGGANNWVVMDAVGTKGKGKFIVETPLRPDPQKAFETIELRLEDGTVIQIR